MSVRSKTIREGEAPAESERDASELPEGWATTTLDALFDFKYGKGLRKDTRDDTGVVSVYGSNGVVGKHSSAVTSGPTIIVGRKGSVGEVHLCPEPCWPIDTTYFIDEFPCDLPPSYWANFLKSLGLGDHDKSSAIPGISREDIYKVIVPVPPLAEQRRIVAKLELLLGKVSSSQQRLSRVPGLLKRFRQSVLAAACSGKLTADWREQNNDVDSDSLTNSLPSLREDLWRQRSSNRGRSRSAYKPPFLPAEEWNAVPSTWSIVTVSQVAILDQGFAFKSSEFSSHGIRLLRGENLEPGKLRWTDTRYWPEDRITEVEQLLIDEGEIILALDRPVISTGLKIARATNNDLPCLLVQRMMRFKMVDARLTPWLFFNLNLPAFIQHLSSGLTGSDLPHVTGTGVAEYTFGLPPLSEQQEIVRRVEKLFAFADQIESRLKHAQTHVDRLTQSLLAKAFRGELVPQKSSDVPASVLLDQLRVERESMNRKTSKKVN